MGSQIAFTNGKTLTLVSPGSGESSRLQLSPPRFSDALPLVLGLEPGTFRGQAASSVVFVAIKSFKKVDLPEGAAIKLAIDQVPATEVEFPKGRYTPFKLESASTRPWVTRL